MMLGLSLVLLGTTGVPAYAQKRNFISYIKNAFGKKTPVTAVPNNLPNRAPSKLALNAAVERKIAQKQFSLSENILKKIQETDLITLMDKVAPATSERKFYPPSDFSQLITPDTPQFIPISIHVQIDPEQDIEIMSDIQKNSYPTGPKHDRVVLNTIKKIDSFFFIEHNGKFYLNVAALKKGTSYEKVLYKLQEEINSKYLRFHSTVLVKVRNKQIMDALKYNQSHGINSLDALHPQADIFTQRAAEEIKNSVKNLSPANPLRQAIENVLMNAVNNGYITPIEDNPIR